MTVPANPKAFTLAALLGVTSLVSAEVLFRETFSDDAWKQRWTPSTYREDLGPFELTSGQWYADKAYNAALKTGQDYRFYALSADMTPFTNKDKTLVVQYDVKNEQGIDCGGGYLKLFPSTVDPLTLNGDSSYNIMFGPDYCGSKAMVHAIFNYKGTNHNLKKTVAAPTDQYTHTYTLVVKPDQTYQVLVDGEEKAAGLLVEDWDFLPPKTIKDPNASKPEDWVDDSEVDDPNDKKPDTWDAMPEFLADPEAVKPEDWDDDMDGEWEAPSIPNPDYKGVWEAKKIPNPAYKGAWVHPEINNPDYALDTDIYSYEDFKYLGLDLWQVKSGSLFDNFLITDSVEEAESARKATADLAEKEKEAKKEYDEAEAAKEAANKPAEEVVQEEPLTDADISFDEDLGDAEAVEEETPKETKVERDEL
ncbi:Calreticulin family-domain-containing protein [Spinellus fusiger]|nr:Calreticulin family-domain-containing protein [Spinellus fusiger]